MLILQFVEDKLYGDYIVLFWTLQFVGHVHKIKILRSKIISMSMKATVYRNFSNHATFDFIAQVDIFPPPVKLDFKLFKD